MRNQVRQKFCDLICQPMQLTRHNPQLDLVQSYFLLSFQPLLLHKWIISISFPLSYSLSILEEVLFFYLSSMTDQIYSFVCSFHLSSMIDHSYWFTVMLSWDLPPGNSTHRLTTTTSTIRLFNELSNNKRGWWHQEGVTMHTV